MTSQGPRGSILLGRPGAVGGPQAPGRRLIHHTAQVNPLQYALAGQGPPMVLLHGRSRAARPPYTNWRPLPERVSQHSSRLCRSWVRASYV